MGLKLYKYIYIKFFEIRIVISIINLINVGIIIINLLYRL